MNTDETELILKAQRGDVAAFEQLVFRHDRHVLNIAVRYATTAEDAKDIYQEVFMRVYRGIRRFRFRSDFATWVHRITVNVCLTQRARSKRAIHVSIHEGSPDDESEPHGPAELRAEDPLPDQKAADTQTAERIREAMQHLSPRQHMAFTLKYLEGYALKEISAMMDCTEGTVKRYLFDATGRMRKRLKDVD